MSGFEEWWAKQVLDLQYVESREVAEQAWDAATYAMNQEQGIAANEAAKDERRKVAVDQIAGEWLEGPHKKLAVAWLDAIIKVAQG